MKSIPLNDVANIAVMHFAKTDVLISQVQQAERRQNLLRALLLNCYEHQPVNILFKNDQADLFAIECSVMAVTDEHVVVKSWIIIPIKSIMHIELL